MSLSHLVACPACARHVRASESACPFCKSELHAQVVTAPRQGPARRLSRAALYAFGVGSLTMAAACGRVQGNGLEKDGGDGDAPVLDTGIMGNPDVVLGVHYGMAPFDAEFPEDAAFAPPYGIAPAFDAGEEEPDAGNDDAGTADAARLEDANVTVPYGTPPGGK